ncbi:TIGR01777 family oxidoreductase [Mucilaginibacter myungsuensis]|uniref:TIGR01777 family protein n=1 Tax=Mucilaginibacter myungsuensis TaxID=649104 RepID=A0A929PXS1_9SPHI|nr:TIGR01777 family oxidoreductase [Mucilaginibacter myungsuensis]MBE9664158.1 TIGR01777 family protein [Mucilaginibacter myungsuensis]MDN3599861.1 TIGR01777 family oxidoreductase [Mucilaginibacter myungsuensis]
MKANNKHILITGASGLIGKQLTLLLLNEGYTVSHLARKPATDRHVKTFVWDVPNGRIDPNCINGVDTIIHLAGAGVAEKRWTNARKQELYNSRVKSIQLLYNLLKNKKHQVSKVISASATGYYGDRGEELLNEDSAPGNDFLAKLCIDWETAVDEANILAIPTLKFRTGIVLDKNGGALPQLATPIKLGVGSPLGTGKQYMPWIHHEDVARLYLYGVQNEPLDGAYNMVAPSPLTNAQLSKAVAKQLKRPLWLPNVPAFVIKLLFGEMGVVVLGGANVSANKIEQAGFQFKYPDIESALKEIYE